MKMKFITRFTSMILSLSCILHIGFIIKDILYPDLPEISIYKQDLKDIEFPVSFIICVDQLENDTLKYQEVGYKNVWRFYMGESMHNESIIGWRGHVENGTKYDTVEGSRKKISI